MEGNFRYWCDSPGAGKLQRAHALFSKRSLNSNRVEYCSPKVLRFPGRAFARYMEVGIR